jgi:hypothetical protein
MSQDSFYVDSATHAWMWEGKIKVKLALCLMKTYGEWRYNCTILDFDTRWNGQVHAPAALLPGKGLCMRTQDMLEWRISRFVSKLNAFGFRRAQMLNYYQSACVAHLHVCRSHTDGRKARSAVSLVTEVNRSSARLQTPTKYQMAFLGAKPALNSDLSCRLRESKRRYRPQCRLSRDI